MGLPLLLTADGHRRQALDGLDRHPDHADHELARTARRRRRAGIRGSATSSSRASSSSRTRPARAWTSTPSSRSCGCRSTARSAATSRATSTSTSTTTCGWSRVTTRRRAASTPAAWARSTTSSRTSSRPSAPRARPAGTFTLTFKGQTTAPLPFDATAAQIDTALEALSTVGANQRPGHRRAGQLGDGDDQRLLPARAAAGRSAAADRRRRRPDRRDARDRDGAGGRLVPASVRRRPPWRAEHERPARQGPADQGQGRQTSPPRTPTRPTSAPVARTRSPPGTCSRSTAGAPQEKTRAEVYAMGFRNPFRIQVDENDVAYVSDYSPDSRPNVRGRGPAGTGRYEIVRKPSNYGWPVCYKRDLGFNKWSHHEWPASTALTPAPNPNSQGVPATATPELVAHCGGATIPNTSRWNLEGGPSVEPGLRARSRPSPIRTSGTPTTTTRRRQPLGTPCAAYFQLTPGPSAPGSQHRVPAAVPGARGRRRRPARHRQVQLRPEQPEPEEVPAVLRRLRDPRRVHPRHAARGASSTRRTASTR